MAQNQVRIIGGMHKGRKLRFPSRGALRPTLSRARETLFNWLIADVVDARCLDLFAGSGALGFEALSRGAASVTLVDQDAAVVRALKATAAELGADNVDIHRTQALSFLGQVSTQRTSDPEGFSTWDLVFVDPPFKSPDQISKTLKTLTTKGLLSDTGLVYVEHDQRTGLESIGDTWLTLKSSSIGDSRLRLLARNR
jgi:16S rRNA (guanine966-N2)-methyltransferase